MSEQPDSLQEQMSEELSDDQIIVELFRMARSGRFKRVAALKEAALEMLEPVTAERIDTCMVKLANILYENDYQGYASDYRYSTRRRRA